MADEVTYEVDPDVCTGSQLCVAIAPDHFAYDADEGISRATASPAEDTEAVLDAAENCPVEAIIVRDAGTGEQLFP